MINKNLIGISGKISSGKDTVAKMIQEKVDDNYEVKKFAGKLKQVASLLTGHSVEAFENKDFKNERLGEEWVFWSYDGVTAFDKTTEKLSYDWEIMTVRKFLQKLGTEGLRNGLHKNVWVNALFSDYNNSGFSINAAMLQDIGIQKHSDIVLDMYNGDWVEYANDVGLPDRAVSVINGSKWIVTDMRFKNEYEAVKDRGGICVRLTKNDDVESTHLSETDLDNIQEWDYIIDNKAQSLEETEAAVAKMLEDLQIPTKPYKNKTK